MQQAAHAPLVGLFLLEEYYPAARESPPQSQARLNQQAGSPSQRNLAPQSAILPVAAATFRPAAIMPSSVSTGTTANRTMIFSTSL